MKTKKLVDRILQEAIQIRTSDIFLLPKKEKYQLLFRNKMGIKEIDNLQVDEGKEIINIFKYSAQMDISEHRRPQVGAMTYSYEQNDYFLRLSSLGDFNDQESLVIRIIYKLDASKYFLKGQFEQILSLAYKRGLIITSGPTGSGKTTTMYELAKGLGNDKIVLTIEDPVEIEEERFIQAQINKEAGIDYLDLLKAALRHRPDVLIVGELRDKATARVALDAALSGHLVLATVHARNTLQTISRLEGLGLRTDELANCLTAVCYQRLLPTQTGLSCLMDIADSDKLHENLFQKVRGDFVNWKQNLALLKEEGEIDDRAFQLFKEG